MAETSYDIEQVSFARPIQGMTREWMSHAFVELPAGERRGVFLNVGPLIVTKGEGDLVHLQINDSDRFRQSWPTLATKAAQHIANTNGKKLSFSRLCSAIENPFKEDGLTAKLASKLSLKDNRGAIVRSLFPQSNEENGWALLQFEGLLMDGPIIVPKFILHGMLLIREDVPEEFDVMNLTDMMSPNFDDLESQIPITNVPE